MTWATDRIAEINIRKDDLETVAADLAALDATELEQYIISAATLALSMPEEIDVWIGQLDEQVAALES